MMGIMIRLAIAIMVSWARKGRVSPPLNSSRQAVVKPKEAYKNALPATSPAANNPA